MATCRATYAKTPKLHMSETCTNCTAQGQCAFVNRNGSLLQVVALSQKWCIDGAPWLRISTGCYSNYALSEGHATGRQCRQVEWLPSAHWWQYVSWGGPKHVCPRPGRTGKGANEPKPVSEGRQTLNSIIDPKVVLFSRLPRRHFDYSPLQPFLRWPLAAV